MRKQSPFILTGVAAFALAGAAAAGASPSPRHHHACHAWRQASAGPSGVVRPGRHWHAGGISFRGHWREHGWREYAGREDLGYGLYRHEQGSFHEEEHSWSSSDGGMWADWGYERPSAVDQFGYLTWPGKHHFVREVPSGAPEGGPPEALPPPPPPPGAMPPPPPPPESEDGYEIRRF